VGGWWVGGLFVGVVGGFLWLVWCELVGGGGGGWVGCVGGFFGVVWGFVGFVLGLVGLVWCVGVLWF
jgi:hypothetical protein